MVMDILQVELVPMIAGDNVKVTELPPVFHEFFALEEQE
jgi:hypothetical protein